MQKRNKSHHVKKESPSSSVHNSKHGKDDKAGDVMHSRCSARKTRSSISKSHYFGSLKSDITTDEDNSASGEEDHGVTGTSNKKSHKKKHESKKDEKSHTPTKQKSKHESSETDESSSQSKRKRTNPLGMSDHDMLLALDESSESSSRLRKRKFPQSYQVNRKKCPITGCDSRGHLFGKYEHHFTVASCPIYHNLTPERCRENHEAHERLRKEREAEAKVQKESESASHHNTRKLSSNNPLQLK